MRLLPRLVLGLGALASVVRAGDAVWQWSAPAGKGRAFLWIPEDCRQVRAVVVAQHNMIEQGILEHATMRRTLAGLGLAEVLIAPPLDPAFRFDRGAGERFDAILASLARESGYTELASAPVVPLGHSACASFPWNFAAWAPQRTLAVLSIKGDAPRTDLTGSGVPNPDWGARRIDGIPGLMVMSEQEWWEARLAPLLSFRKTHPRVPLAVLADTGHGHFDASDELVAYLACFIRQAAAARLPADGVATLRTVDPTRGWLVDRWRADQPPRAAPAALADYRGDRDEAVWCFDEEMARATAACHRRSFGKKSQQVDFVQAGEAAPVSTTHAGIELKFLPEPDGITFQLGGDFIDPLPRGKPLATKDKPPPPQTYHPRLAPAAAHASGGVRITRIVGPAAALDAGRFRVAFDHAASTGDPRDHDIWFAASHPGDAHFKGTVQQALLRLPRYAEGRSQTLTFPALPDVPLGTTEVPLAARSDADLPVGYYVREGPAFVRDGGLHLTALPPRARLPVEVTVVAWQIGRGRDPKIRAAAPVARSFWLKAP